MFDDEFDIVTPWKAIIAWTVGIALVVGSFVGYPLYQISKAWRSEILVAQSQDAAANNNIGEAFQKALSAHYLNPEDSDIMLNLARQSAKVDHPQNLKWWLSVLNHPDITPEDRLSFLELCLRRGQLTTALNYLPSLADGLPDTKESWALQLEMLRQSRQFPVIIDFVTKKLAAGHQDWELHRALVDARTAIPSAESRKAAIEHLRTITEPGSPVELRAMRSIVYLRDITSQERNTYIDRILAHPDATREDKLLSYTMAIRSRSEKYTYQGVKDSVIQLFNFKDMEDLELYASWLDFIGEPEEAIKIIEESRLKPTRAAFVSLLRSKLATGQVDEAFDLTLESVDKSPLDEVESILARAATLRSQGLQKEAREALVAATQVASVEQATLVERELLLLDEYELLISMYQRLMREPGYSLNGKAKLLSAYYNARDENGLLSTLHGINIDEYQSQPSVLNFIAYLEIVYGRRVGPARRALEQLCSRYPNVADFRLTLGLAYLRSGEAKVARLLVGEPRLYPDINNRQHLQVAAATIYANGGRINEGKTFLDTDTWPETMLPGERRLVRRYAPELL